MRLGVADEPLVGLDGDRAVGMVRAVQQRRREPVLVAAVGDLADELVDQVAAVGEDQDAAGSRALDEAERGDRLAGAGRVLEPEAPARRPGPRAPRRRPPLRVVGRLLPVLGLLVWRQRLVLLGDLLGAPVPAVAVRELGADRRSAPSRQPRSERATRSVPALAATESSSSAVSAARVPESTSTWCSVSSAPSASVGPARRRAAARARAAASTAPPLGRGGLAAGVELGQRGSTARRRAVPGARSSMVSPSSRIGSRVNSRTRSRSASVIGLVALAATSTDFAMGRSSIGSRAADPNRRARAL